MKWDCLGYENCKKNESCEVLGECVFGHSLLAGDCHPQAILNIHYGRTAGASANVFRTIKRQKQFNGKRSDAQGHLNSLILDGTLKKIN